MTSLECKRAEFDKDDHGERRALLIPTFNTKTDFTWFDIPARLHDLANAPISSKNSIWVGGVVMTAVGLNNYVASQSLSYQFRWTLEPNPELFMAKNDWADWENDWKDWQDFPPVRRQFACSLENAAWGKGWRGAQILRIKMSLTTTMNQQKVGVKDARNVVLRAHPPEFEVFVERPMKRGNPKNVVQCGDASAIFAALLAVFEKPEYLAAWDDVREEVLGD